YALHGCPRGVRPTQQRDKLDAGCHTQHDNNRCGRFAPSGPAPSVDRDEVPGWRRGVGHDAGMSSYVSHTTVDCADAYTLSVWWQGVLDYGMDPDDPNEPGHEECLIISPDGHHRILFIEVPDEKQVKNRIHFDLRPREGTRDEELTRLLAHGA